MNRYLSDIIKKDLEKKMVFISGPRQVGKTTLAKNFLVRDEAGYLSWDVPEGREAILRRHFPHADVVIFDELHKFRTWRTFLKGTYDDPKRRFGIIVTGSARLDIFNHGGDSLQGRYNLLRLHPLSVAELSLASYDDMMKLIALGGFPEPYLSGSIEESRRWSRQYRDRLIAGDIRDLENIQDLGKLEHLMLRVPELVGSPLSINALHEDLQVAHKTVDRWFEVFERMYAVYRLSPYASSRIKSLRKSRKCYMYNWSVIENDGARFENFVASHLLKWTHYQQDVYGRDVELCFLRDSTGREVDFLIREGRKVLGLIECKASDTAIDRNLRYFAKIFPEAQALQVVRDASSADAYTNDGISVTPALDYLRSLV
jgi:predicted AAA+ superfamily ATPase